MPEANDIERILHDAALSIALHITPQNPQYVIKRLLPDNCYRIVSGMPPNSERHGIGEIGNLLEPTPKRALLRAINKNEIVIVDDATTDEDVTCYMASHIASKKIQSMVIVPLCRGTARWLIIIDKALPCRKGFSQQDRELLERYKASTEKGLNHIHQGILGANDRTIQKALSEYAHLFRNPLTIIGGFAERLKKIRDPEKIRNYADIISAQAKRMEDDFCSFMSLLAYLFPNGHKKKSHHLEEYLSAFRSDPHYHVQFDPDILNCRIMVVPAAARALFMEMRKYLRCSSRREERILFKAARNHSHVNFTFHSSAFQHFKEDTDVRLPIFREVVYNLDGNFSIGKGQCRISLPLDRGKGGRKGKAAEGPVRKSAVAVPTA